LGSFPEKQVGPRPGATLNGKVPPIGGLHRGKGPTLPFLIFGLTDRPKFLDGTRKGVSSRAQFFPSGPAWGRVYGQGRWGQGTVFPGKVLAHTAARRAVPLYSRGKTTAPSGKRKKIPGQGPRGTWENTFGTSLYPSQSTDQVSGFPPIQGGVPQGIPWLGKFPGVRGRGGKKAVGPKENGKFQKERLFEGLFGAGPTSNGPKFSLC